MSATVRVRHMFKKWKKARRTAVPSCEEDYRTILRACAYFACSLMFILHCLRALNCMSVFATMTQNLYLIMTFGVIDSETHIMKKVLKL